MGDFSLDDMDSAMKAVSKARSKMGAKTNALNHTINYNENASLNLMAANSRIRDTNYGKAVTDKSRSVKFIMIPEVSQRAVRWGTLLLSAFICRSFF